MTREEIQSLVAMLRGTATATAAKPGTEEKIAVMAERAKRGESVFHPRDGQA